MEYNYICKFFDLIGNYSQYRQTVKQLKVFDYIPAMPILLKDITFLVLTPNKFSAKTWLKLGYILYSILTPYRHDIVASPSFQAIIDTQPIVSEEILRHRFNQITAKS